MDEQLKILFFGAVAEITHTPMIMIQRENDSDSLLRTLTRIYPGIEHISYSIAVNRQIVTSNICLQAGDEIALLPPFSGG